MFLFYSVMTMVMRFSSAVVVNLSLLTADVYTALFGFFFFHYKVTLLYELPFLTVMHCDLVGDCAVCPLSVNVQSVH